jgi:putative endonuclease
MDTDNKRHMGGLGEEAAARYLTEKGFRIVCRNSSSRWGEIDIIAEDSKWIIFAEVKTRTGNHYGDPEESIDTNKVERIRKAASLFLVEKEFWGQRSVRFDIISIVIDRKKLERCLQQPAGNAGLAGSYRKFSRLEHIIDAF